MDRHPEPELVACYARVLRALIVFSRNREHGEVAFHDALNAAHIPGVIDGIRRADAWVFAVGVRGPHEGAPCDKDLGFKNTGPQRTPCVGSCDPVT